MVCQAGSVGCRERLSSPAFVPGGHRHRLLGAQLVFPRPGQAARGTEAMETTQATCPTPALFSARLLS